MKIAVIGSGNIELPQIGASLRNSSYRPVKSVCGLGHEVHFFDSANSPTALDTDCPKLYIQRVTHPNFHFSKSNNWLIAALGISLNMIGYSASLFFKLSRLLRKENFDIIHVHTRYDAVSVILLQRLMSYHIPMVFTCHNSDWSRQRLSLFLRLFFLPEVFAIRKSDVVVAVTETQKAGILRRIHVEPEKIRVLYGINRERFRPGTKHGEYGPYLVCFSDLTDRKNQLVLVRAMPEILKYFPGCRLVLIGGIRDKDYLADINRVSEQLGVSQSVDITGKLPFEELLSWIHRADICAVPTKREGVPTVLLEVLACQKAVVASRIPEIMELNNLAGQDIFATASPFEPSEWSAKIIELLSDEKKRHEYEQNADRIVVDQVEEARRYVSIYQELAGAAA
jgi:glycosyltransferase involved in cell wall biosynthesis